VRDAHFMAGEFQNHRRRFGGVLIELERLCR
jgi:hypothetical protein